MSELDCARQDLQGIGDALTELEARIATKLVNIREHFNRLETELENRAESQASVRRRATRGESITADPTSVFLARVEAGDTTAKSLMDIIERVGLRVAANGDHKAAGTVRCFSTLEAIYLRNADLVERSLRVIVDAWGGMLQSLRADFVSGVAAFLADAGPIDDRELSRRLRPLSPVDVMNATAGDRRRNLPAYLTDVYTR